MRLSGDYDALIASAQARGVPVISARQMLKWLDGRNGSSFGSIAWNGTRSQFHGFSAGRGPTVCRRWCRLRRGLR